MRRFQTQHGRDLEWVLTSPPLLFHKLVVDAKWGERQLARHAGLAARLDQPGSPLHKAIGRMRSARLGEYFETILGTWLEHVPESDVVGSNIQVNGNGGTIGEFDLVFRRDRRVHHWELAVKFYLGYPGPSGPIWYGPNPADVLREKWRKMRKHQLRLGEHPAAEPALRKMHVRSKLRTAAYVRGYLYEALDPAFATHHHPHSNRDALRGWWSHRSAAASVLPDVPVQTKWVRLSKLEWLSPTRREGGAETLGQLLDGLPNEHAHHVAGVLDGEEITRGFVVPDGWPRG